MSDDDDGVDERKDDIVEGMDVDGTNGGTNGCDEDGDNDNSSSGVIV